jgi:gliding motility-associated lipoprotein GldB
MFRYISLFIVLNIFFGCSKKEKLNVDVSDITVNTVIKRFDQDFYTSPVSKLPELKATYPYLFPGENNDTVWIQKMQNKEDRELFSESQKVFNNFDEQQRQLTKLFQHIKYYFPRFQEPTVITVLTGVDYENRVIYADSLLFVSLDVFLGPKNDIYQNFPNYLKNNFKKEHLLVDVADAIVKVQIPPSKDRSFVSRMIQQGKKMYLIDAYLPENSDAEKIGYSPQSLSWAETNDVEIWKYFVQNKLLFSTDTELSKRFIQKAPFSKFYWGNDNETPGRIGVWLGWQIVRSYMRNNEITLPQLLTAKNEDIFKKSKYKPSK